MDYSAETCQNSFTLGQIEIMRGVLEVQRVDLINFDPVLAVSDKPIANWSVFPNPSTDGSFTINSLSGDETQIEVYNEAGQIISTTVTQSTYHKLELNGSGVFLVKVIENNIATYQRVIVLN